MGERELGQQIQGGRGVFHKKQNRPCPRVFASSTLKTRVARHSAELAQMDHCNHRRTSEKQQRESSKKANNFSTLFTYSLPQAPPACATNSRDIVLHQCHFPPRSRANSRVRFFFLQFFSSFFLLLWNRDRSRVVRRAVGSMPRKFIKISASRHEFRDGTSVRNHRVPSLPSLRTRSRENRPRGEHARADRRFFSFSTSFFCFSFFFFSFLNICISNQAERTTNRIDRRLKMKLEIGRLPWLKTRIW